MEKLDAFTDKAVFLLGHNLVAFDAVHLAAAKPDLRLLRLPRVNTLRINPLAFPRNPYHHLVKHYQDGQLKRGRLNDPELDARLTLEVFRDQYHALKTLDDDSPELLLAWHWLTTVAEPASGLNSFFTLIRGKTRPPEAQALAAVSKYLSGRTCATSARKVMADVAAQAWPLAYVLAWLSVSGGNSVMPPWVRHQFPEAGRMARRLRDTACTDPACRWCRERHDARKELTRWFGFPDFRPESAISPNALRHAAFRGACYLAVSKSGLREAAQEYGLETGGAELPREHFVDWLAQWGQDMRRRQTGLLLLTAHRAKGLEFDHVAVLDGGWDRVGKGEDPDAPRRLYYVAMTRARRTLILARLGKGNGLLVDLPDDPSLLFRDSAHLPAPPPELGRIYMRVSLKALDLGFAGRYAQGKGVHQAISALRPGDPIRLLDHQGKWELLDASGNVVGRMSKHFVFPERMAFSHGSVFAVIRRKREDVEAAYQDHVRCDNWELVVPELVFMPDAQALR